MIHLKMIGLGLLTIFKTIGLSILILLGISLAATLFGGWILFFKGAAMDILKAFFITLLVIAGA
ncbi:hypothetical protein MOB40_20890, partial [Bacillus inaquosorum]|uniref:hypothetical protein n=1 Tax=Bacillus inaquosorum TaxID=483913 RepID=UPI002282EE64